MFQEKRRLAVYLGVFREAGRLAPQNPAQNPGGS